VAVKRNHLPRGLVFFTLLTILGFLFLRPLRLLAKSFGFGLYLSVGNVILTVGLMIGVVPSAIALAPVWLHTIYNVHLRRCNSWHRKIIMAHVILWNCNPTYESHASPTRVLGPYQLASWLRQQGYIVKVIDYAQSMQTSQLVAITNLHVDKDTLAIGASTTFWPNDNHHARLTGGASEERLPLPTWVTDARQLLEHEHVHIHWALGGTRSHQYAQSDWHTFSGQAEDTFTAWLDDIAETKQTKRQRFDIRSSSKRYADDDFISPWEVLPIELGRGCMFRCKFCSYDQIGKTPGTYLRDYELIRQEILDHHQRWGTRRFYYVDDTVNESREKVQALRDIAASMPFRLEWIGYVRADLMWAHPETEPLLLESGMRSPFFGIESFEENSSKLIGKGWSGKHAKDWLLERRHRWGTSVTWTLGMIAGLPGQTPQQLEDDNRWINENDMHNWRWAALWLSPDQYQSEFSRNATKYGFRFPDPQQPWYWETDEWTLTQAREYAIRFMTQPGKMMRPAGWGLGEYASLGFELDDIMQDYLSTEWKQMIAKRKLEFLENYVQRNLNVHG
jgi:Radical SAM superfamily